MSWVIGVLLVIFGKNWVITILVAVVGFFAAKYFSKAGRAAKAREVLILADSITDSLLEQYPSSLLSRFLDKAVDQLIKSAGIKRDIAKRAITASYVKAMRVPYKPIAS